MGQAQIAQNVGLKHPLFVDVSHLPVKVGYIGELSCLDAGSGIGRGVHRVLQIDFGLYEDTDIYNEGDEGNEHQNCGREEHGHLAFGI